VRTILSSLPSFEGALINTKMSSIRFWKCASHVDYLHEIINCM